MIQPDPDLERAYDAIQEHGCPICGEPASYLAVQYVDAIKITPCGHIVVIEDAIHMERFYDALEAGGRSARHR